jgi:putative ABC transport system permease protein
VIAILGFTVRGLTRAPGRTAVRIAALAAAVSLLGAMLVFVSHSLETMTASATAEVPLAWQGPVDSYPAAERVAAAVGSQAGVAAAAAAATAPIAGAGHLAPAGLIRTGAGAIVAVPTDYPERFHTLRMLRGRLAEGSVVLDQQFAATLQAQIGDTVTLTVVPGAPPQRFTVSGIALVTSPDTLFAPLDPRAGPAPAQPPAEIAVMPVATFSQRIAPLLRSITPATIGSSSVPGAQNGIQWQVQTTIDPSALHGDPASALQQDTRLRNRVERTLPGQVQFVDNLGDALTNAAGDALYAEALYIMLAVPGALVALGLVYLAALGTAERDRRDLALLRARGASRRHLTLLAVTESVILGMVAGLVGAAGSIAAVRALVAGSTPLPDSRVAATAVACVLLAIAGALVARLAATATALRGTVSEGRRSAHRTDRPLWQRLWLDVAALTASGLIFWFTLRTGFSAVVNPDSNPTLSLSVYMFLAPLLLWVGATLLLVRLRGRIVAVLARSAGGTRAGGLPGFLLASAGRRGPAINRGLVLISLLLAFGVQLGVFAATYDNQAAVDAQLTIGADVAVTAAPDQTADIRRRAAAVTGVAAATGVDHAYAYVGPDLQDTYGIDPASFTRATTLRDSYFLGASAAETLRRLAATPDGLLVSKETITDYSLQVGDLVRLRVLDHRTGQFVVAPFHVAGVVQEFPSAPKDSFMVARLDYLERVTHGTGPNVVFVRTSDDPTAVARRIAAATATSRATITTIRQQTQRTTSSITTVDLTAISRIEQVFAVLLVAAAVALYVHLALAERRRELATMAALGIPARDVSAFLWSEAALIVAASGVFALGLGLLLAAMLTAMLTHVFDPPPDHLTIPWTYLALLLGAAAATTMIAAAAAEHHIRRLPLGAILRE